LRSRRTIEVAAHQIGAAQPAMAPFQNLAERLRTGRKIASVCTEILGEIDSSDEAIARHAMRLMAGRPVVLTHSFSGTAANFLISAFRAGRVSRVIATESRPLCEGFRLAELLAAAGVPVDLVLDAAVALLLTEAGIVLLGADTITAQSVVNKIGTSLVALAAKQQGTPAYVLASELKKAPPTMAIRVDQRREPLEIAQPIPGCRIRNYYFEATPRTWFAGIVTEQGLT
jgi:translation initiation factor 2B subunit (eIF-2B alpha/beta/delta family)